MESNECNTELLALPVDIENTQQICVYLRNLRKRLKETVQQHTDTIQRSVGIIKEITDVSTALALTQRTPDQPPTDIKRLIMEFENMTAGESDLSSMEELELRGLLVDFRRLHDSQLLLDSLMCFKRAKESFEEVNAMLSHITCHVDDVDQTPPQNSQRLMGSNSDSRSLREKIHAFNKASVTGQNMLESFTHCFSFLSNGDDVNVNGTLKSPDVSSSHGISGDEDDGDRTIDQIETIDDTK